MVIDCGLSRVPRYEPDVGLTRLETVRVSRAAADQRRGRAGRTEPGVCYRLWDEPQTGALEPYTKPEILAADLSSFLLDLAQWGASDPGALAFLDPPPAAALAEARTLLRELGAIDLAGRITEEGRCLRALPLPPRLARMVVDAAALGAGRLAAEIAAVLTERGLGGDDADLRHRLDQFRRDRSRRGEDARAMAKRWVQIAARPHGAPAPNSSSFTSPLVREVGGPTGPAEGRPDGKLRPSGGGALERLPPSPTLPRKRGGSTPNLLGGEGSLLALAYPDRIAKNRGGGSGGFLLANGRGGLVDAASPLAREPFLAVAELTGAAAASRIVLAAPITLEEIEARFAAQIDDRETVTFDAGSASLRARRTRRLGALVLSDRPKAVTPTDETARTLAEGIAQLGVSRLPWSKSLRQWRDRVMFLRRATDLGFTRDRQSIEPKSAKADLGGNDWPDLSDAALAASVQDWLEPILMFKTALDQISIDEFDTALTALVPRNLRRRLDAEAPTHFTAPSGSHVPIDYDAEAGPKLSIRVQELFGLAQHPSIAGGRVPLIIELLSPAHRPVQVTRDLPGFWRGSYAQVKTEMRGRYPRHPWPDDPLHAPATRRAKRRGE